MSGIYIPMEMPRGCLDCQFRKHDMCKKWLKVWDCAVNRPDNCPLVAVPDHGRLIDADKLKKQIEDENRFSAVYEKATFRYLDNAPTIIPADKEADGDVCL